MLVESWFPTEARQSPSVRVRNPEKHNQSIQIIHITQEPIIKAKICRGYCKQQFVAKFFLATTIHWESQHRKLISRYTSAAHFSSTPQCYSTTWDHHLKYEILVKAWVGAGVLYIWYHPTWYMPSAKLKHARANTSCSWILSLSTACKYRHSFTWLMMPSLRRMWTNSPKSGLLANQRWIRWISQPLNALFLLKKTTTITKPK